MTMIHQHSEKRPVTFPAWIAVGVVLAGLCLTLYGRVLQSQSGMGTPVDQGLGMFGSGYRGLYDATTNLFLPSGPYYAGGRSTPTAVYANWPLSVLGQDRAAAAMFWWNLLCVAGGLFITARAFAKAKRARSADPISTSTGQMIMPAVLAGAFSWPLMVLLNRADLDGIILLLLSITFWTWARARAQFAGGLALAAAGSLALYPLVMVLPILLRRRWWMLLGTIIGSVGLWYVTRDMWTQFVTTGPLHNWWNHNENVTNASWPTFIGSLARGFSPSSGASSPFPETVGVALWLILMLAYIVFDLESLRPRSTVVQAALAATYLPLLVAAPFMVPASSLTILLIVAPALCVLWTSTRTSAERTWLIVAAIGLGLSQLHGPGLSGALESNWLTGCNALGSLMIAIAGLGYRRARLLAGTDEPPPVADPADAVLLTTPIVRPETPISLVGERPAGNRAITVPYSLPLRRDTRSPFRGSLYILGAIGSAALMMHWYSAQGYSSSVAALWLASILLGYVGLRRMFRKHGTPRVAGTDIVVAGLITAVFVPVYLVGLYYAPHHVSTDEIAIMEASRRIVVSNNPDPFGLDPTYFFFPAGCFYAFGWLSEMLGGVDFSTGRAAGGITSLAIIFACYFFFRQLLERPHAIAATVLVGASHVLMGLGRMALRDNQPVLIEAAALALMISGVRRRDPANLFLGGAVAALGVYSYFSGRLIMPMACAVLGMIWVFRWRSSRSVALPVALAAVATAVAAYFAQQHVLMIVCAIIAAGGLVWWRGYQARDALRLSVPTLAGFLIAASLMAIATDKLRDEAAEYIKGQSIVTPDGRQMAGDWEGNSDLRWAITMNAIRGLVAFNGDQTDRGYMYINPGHNFVDPVTGILLWIGFGRAVWMAWRRRLAGIVLAIGFLALWLPISLLVTKNPNYCRWLVLIPFISGLTLLGVDTLARLAQRAWRTLDDGGRAGRAAVTCAFVAVVFSLNVFIFADHYHQTREAGDAQGQTIRYIIERRHVGPTTYYVVADTSYPYYWWGPTDAWRNWIQFATVMPQQTEILPPSAVLNDPIPSLNRPCVLLMNGHLWRQRAGAFADAFPGSLVRPITKDFAQVAIEIP